MKTSDTKYLTAKDCFDAIKNLSTSQGYYKALYDELIRARDLYPERFTEYMKNLESQHFKDTVDLVMYLEG